MRGARADDRRPCRIDAVHAGEGERQARERRPAPADGRAAAVRADSGVHRARDEALEAADGVRQLVLASVGPPVEDEVRRLRCGVRDGGLPAVRADRARGDEDARAGRPPLASPAPLRRLPEVVERGAAA